MYTRFITTVVTFTVMTLFSACSYEQREVSLNDNGEVVDGREFVVSLGMHASDLPISELKSGGVENIKQIKHMRILVFDEDKKFLYTTDAVLGESTSNTPTPDTDYLPDGKKGTINTIRNFKARLFESSRPRYLHFVVDYDWANFSQDYFLKGTSAGELIPQLHTTLDSADATNPTAAFSPMWSMVRVEKLSKSTLEGKVIKLLRNYAKIELSIDKSVKEIDNFIIDGYCVANTLNKGMLAPFIVNNYQYEFPFNVTQATVPADAEFLPTPTEKYMIKPNQSFNLFESKNDNDTRKVCVIIKGHKLGEETRKLFYKIDLVNRDNEYSINNYIQILRNNWYVIRISGVKSEGYSTLDEALKAPADNNVFASVKLKHFSKVSDGTYYLDVTPVQMVIVKPGVYSFNTLFNGTSKYTRFYPDWDPKEKPLLGEWTINKDKPDPNLTEFTFKVDQVPADNIEEYKVVVAGLRYADKEGGLNPGDLGYDPQKKMPVIDGVTGATTPITRTVYITLRNPYRFNAKLEDDSTGDMSDKILSFEVYKSIPNSLIPLEILINAHEITPRNTNKNSDLMLVEREVEVNENGMTVKKKKLFYRYILTPEAYMSALNNNNHRVNIPVKINDGTSELKGNITLSSELYSDETIFGAVKPREKSFVISYTLPDGSYKSMPSTAENDIVFKLNNLEYKEEKIKLVSVDDRGTFKLQILDDKIPGTQDLEISTWVTRYNTYGFFKYLVKKRKRVDEWLSSTDVVTFDGVSVYVKGFLYHNSNGSWKPSDPPEIWGMYPKTSLHTDLTRIADYRLSDERSFINGEYGYEFEFLIPEKTYTENANSYYKWTGIGFGYSGRYKWPAYWSQLQSSGRVVWWY